MGITLRTLQQVGSQRFGFILAHLLNLHANTILVFDIIYIWINYERMDDNFSTLLFSAIAFIGINQITLKNYSAVPFYATFVSLVEWIEELYARRVENEVIQKILREELAKAFKFSKLFFEGYNVVFVIAWSLYVFDLVRRPGNNFHIYIPGLSMEEYKLVYYILQCSLYIVCGHWNVIIDTAIVIIGIHIMGFINTVNRMIQGLNDAEVKTKCPNLLVKILIHHVEMIEQLNAFNKGLHLMSFIQFIMSTMIYLAMFYTVRSSNAELIVYSFLVCVLIQLFMLCMFGEIISSRTDKTTTLLWLTNWYEMSLPDQKIFLIILAITQKSFGLKAAGMYEVNIMAFIQIIKVAASYSTLIYALT
ncbi:odorant receptor 4-like [Lutzomyia longipalpis]|uniref:odorant receptor 4-like n=1 Tax=Lutzomyia longipalpis TaxID=7200 RepID=UPI002483FDBD|nr:odorant receptor 4-like [Lutzomyia longipalpis]